MTSSLTITPESPDLIALLESSGIKLRVREVEEHGLINAVEAALKRSGVEVDCPVTHNFIPGHYCRQITMPAGALVVSKRHGTWNPYTITKGNVSVLQETDGQMRVLHVVVAPGEHFSSVTPPDTRRLLLCREETVWTTFHPTELTDVDQIVAAVTLPPNNPLLLE